MSFQIKPTHFDYNQTCFLIWWSLYMLVGWNHIFSTCCTSIIELILHQNTVHILVFRVFTCFPSFCFVLRGSLAEKNLLFLNLCPREGNRISPKTYILSAYHFNMFLLKKVQRVSLQCSSSWDKHFDQATTSQENLTLGYRTGVTT